MSSEYHVYDLTDADDLEKLGQLVGVNISMDRQIVPYATKNVVIAYGTFLTGVGCALHVTILVALYRLINNGGTGLNRHLLALFTICQLFALILVVPFEITREYIGQWRLGAEFCKVWITYGHIFIPTMLWTLFGLCLDRYHHLQAMGVYRYAKRGSGKVSVIIVAILLLSAAGLIPQQVWLHRKSDFLLVEVCAVVVDTPHTTVLSLMHYFIPSTVLVASLFALCCYARRRIAQLQRIERQESLLALSTAARSLNGACSYDIDTYVVDTKNSCVCLTLLACVTICMWSPFYVANLWLAYSKCENSLCFDPKLWALFQWIGYTSALVCPCFVFVDKRVRATVRYWLKLDVEDGVFSYKHASELQQTEAANRVTSPKPEDTYAAVTSQL